MDGISLGQGKYVVEILKRFARIECKDMATPMASNLKLLSDASSDTVDATSDDLFLDVPNEHETKYLLCCEHIETCSPDCCKAYSKIPEGYN